MSNCYIEMIVGFVGRGGFHTVDNGKELVAFLWAFPLVRDRPGLYSLLGKFPILFEKDFSPVRRGLQSFSKETPVLFGQN